ncbi:MAG: hypothetical protein D3920_00810 [Candidatus Electrothrix sp. AW2]|nr:hypothetical protein [Candidatus Electrothrix gigas]
MMDHKEAILEAYNLDESPRRSWKYLCDRIDDFADSMAFNTFKTYFRAFALIVKEYEERENHIDGWSISQGADGYYRAVRRVNGKMVSLYLGKVYDRKKFTDKITQKELSLASAQSEPVKKHDEYEPEPKPEPDPVSQPKLKKKKYSIRSVRKACREFVLNGDDYPRFNEFGELLDEYELPLEVPLEGWFEITRKDFLKLRAEDTLVFYPLEHCYVPCTLYDSKTGQFLI